MSHFEASVLADSISPDNFRVRTIQAVYPRFIHAEAKTHRLIKIGSEHLDLLEEVGIMDDPNLSRSASSSRAIPTKKLIEMVRSQPVMPIYWGKNCPGMKAKEELEGDLLRQAIAVWRKASIDASDNAEEMMRIGAHKEIVNRIIEPYLPIRVVATATEWNNFFALRIHGDAQPEIRLIATLIKDAMDRSNPVLLRPGEWHLPYVSDLEIFAYGGRTDPTGKLRKISSARCARTSYQTHDGRRSAIDEDLELCERLMNSGTVHASPFEHQATPDTYNERDESLSRWAGGGRGLAWEPSWNHPHLHGNLRGFIQNRKTIPGESVPG